MKDGICPMCKSNEVYMNDALYMGGNVPPRGYSGFGFSAGEGRASNVFYFDTYVCLNCGYTAMFAKADFHDAGSEGLSTLKNAKGWKKAG